MPSVQERAADAIRKSRTGRSSGGSECEVGLLKKLFGGGAPPSEAMPADRLRSLVMSTHDSAMALAPEGWAELEIKATFSPDQTLEDLEIGTSGTINGVSPAEDLGIDPRTEFGSLSAAVEELARGMCGADLPSRVTLSCRKADGYAEWRLVDGSGTERMQFRLDPKLLGQLLYTTSLVDALRSAEDEFEQRGEELKALIGRPSRFEARPDQQLILQYQDGASRAFRFERLGSYMIEPATWQWGWSIPELGPERCPAVFRACAPNERQPGMTVLWLPRFQCELSFAERISRLAAYRAGASGVIFPPSQDESRLHALAIFEPMD